jgi:hypothetical protein
MITSERTNEIFLSLKLHYSSKYNYVKYRGRLKQQPKNPNKIFQNIANKYVNEDKVLEFLVSYFVKEFTEKTSIPSIMINYDFDFFNVWSGRFKRFSYEMEQYLSNVDLKEILTKGNLIKEYKQGKLNLDQLTSIIRLFPRKFENNINPIDDKIIEFTRRHIIMLDHLGLYDDKKIFDLIKKHIEKNINNAYYETTE